jgi:hypothetical protein
VAGAGQQIRGKGQGPHHEHQDDGACEEDDERGSDIGPDDPAVSTRQPAPAMKPATASGSSTAHHRISITRRAAAQPSTTTATAPTTSDPAPAARATPGPIGQGRKA